MSTLAKSAPPERSYSHLVSRTIEAFHVAQRAAATAAEGLATASSPLLNTLRGPGSWGREVPASAFALSAIAGFPDDG